MAIERVLVYPDDTIPDGMLEVYRVGGVETWETGGAANQHPELIDNHEYHLVDEMLDDVAKRLVLTDVSLNLTGHKNCNLPHDGYSKLNYSSC